MDVLPYSNFSLSNCRFQARLRTDYLRAHTIIGGFVKHDCLTLVHYQFQSRINRGIPTDGSDTKGCLFQHRAELVYLPTHAYISSSSVTFARPDFYDDLPTDYRRGHTLAGW
jgi:hypothetical protein